MGGAEGTEEAMGKLIFSNLLFFGGNIFAKSNASLVFSLQWLQVEGCVPVGLKGCRAAAPF